MSRLFLYKTTRNLLGWKGDSGAFIRSTFSALDKTNIKIPVNQQNIVSSRREITGIVTITILYRGGGIRGVNLKIF